MLTKTERDELHVCDGCDDTIVCGTGALVSKWKWRRFSGERDEGHGLKMNWQLLLCPDCRSKGNS